MPEEIDIKQIKQNKKLVEKQQKDAEKLAKAEENKTKTKTIKARKNTVLNQSNSNPKPSKEQQIIPFTEYRDGLITMYHDLISKLCSKYIADCNENTLKQRLLMSNDMNGLLNYMFSMNIQNPVLLLLLTTVSHITNDTITNKFKREIIENQPKPPPYDDAQNKND